jgi:hypothetical protein
MNVQRDPDTILAAWLEEGPTALPEATRRAIAVNTRTSNQRWYPIWMPQRRLSMNPYARFAAVATVLVVLIGGALYALAPGSGGVGGPPSSHAASSPTSSPTASQPISTPPATPPPSPFTSSRFKVPVGFTLQDGWTIATDEPGTVGLQLGDAGAAIMDLESMTVRGATSTAPWQPWPDDIHAWMAGRPEFRPDAARTGVVGGHAAVIVDADYVREKITDPGDWIKFGTGRTDGLNMKGSWPGRVRIIVVHTSPTTGIVVMMDAPVDVFDNASASLDRILSTLTFK